MSTTPRKIGLIVSGGNPWEIVFCSFHLEQKALQRTSISIPMTDMRDHYLAMDSEVSRLSMTDIADVKATSIEALIIPGGKRLFNTLCNFEEASDGFRVDENFKTLLKGIYRLEKPIGAFGSSVLILAKALQGISKSPLVVTVGNDPKLQAGIEAAGTQAVVTRPSEVVLDQTNRLVTSGGELGTKRLSEVSESCSNLATGIKEFINR